MINTKNIITIIFLAVYDLNIVDDQKCSNINDRFYIKTFQDYPMP